MSLSDNKVTSIEIADKETLSTVSNTKKRKSDEDSEGAPSLKKSSSEIVDLSVESIQMDFNPIRIGPGNITMESIEGSNKGSLLTISDNEVYIFNI